MVSRIEASIFAESALIDKETGRIYWQGGSASNLRASLIPKLQEAGIFRLKATILSYLLVVAILGWLAFFLEQRLLRLPIVYQTPQPIHVSALLRLVHFTILKVPRFSPKFISTLYAVYLLEAATCSTRRYLTHRVVSPEGVEAYIENLRLEDPVVTWKVRSFHYASLWQRLRGHKTADPKRTSPGGLLRSKVVTHDAEGTYVCDRAVDKTIAGVWRRAPNTTQTAPFTKILLSKVLVLANSKARDDYFQQQAEFVTQYGQLDKEAEFSTSFDVPTFQPRLLAVKKGASFLYRLSWFWIFTLMGLSLPYRSWFTRHCDDLRVTVVKETYASDKPTWTRWRSTRRDDAAALMDEENFKSLMKHMELYKKDDDVEAVPAQANVTDLLLELNSPTEILDDHSGKELFLTDGSVDPSTTGSAAATGEAATPDSMPPPPPLPAASESGLPESNTRDDGKTSNKSVEVVVDKSVPMDQDGAVVEETLVSEDEDAATKPPGAAVDVNEAEVSRMIDEIIESRIGSSTRKQE